MTNYMLGQCLDNAWTMLGQFHTSICSDNLGSLPQSHSLTTELSQVVTTELTESLTDMVAGLLSDSLSETVPDRIVRQIKRALVRLC